MNKLPPRLISVAELAKLPGMPTRQYLRRCAKEGRYKIEQVRGNGGVHYEFMISSLPKDWQLKIFKSCEQTKNPAGTVEADASCTQKPSGFRSARKDKTGLISLDELQARFEKASKPNQDRAAERIKALHRVNHLYWAGIKLSDAVTSTAEEFEVTTASIWNWRKKVRGYPESVWMLMLIDGYEGHRNNVRDVSADFLKLVASVYMRKTQPSFNECLIAAKREAGANGTDIPTCSEKTIRRHFDRMYSAETQCYAREGLKAWEAKYWASMQRDRSMLRALQVINGDGHKFDYWVAFPDGTVGRAMGTFWMDLSSNYLFPPRIEKSENMDSIRLSFLNICDTVGVPEIADVDNGMGYAGKDLSGQDKTRRRFKKMINEAKGIFCLLGIRTIWAEVAHGQSKPIERAFGTLEGILKTFPELEHAYLGNCPGKRPDEKRIAVPLDVLTACVMEAVHRYNVQTGRKSDGIKANGRSYKEIWEAKLVEAQRDGKIRRLEDWERRYCVMPGRVVNVQKQNGGIFTLHSNQYQAHELTKYLGQRIQVRFDPQNLKDARCYTLDGEFICAPQMRVQSAFLDTRDLRDYKAVKNERRKLVRKQSEVTRRIDVLESVKGGASADVLEQIDADTDRLLKAERAHTATRLAANKKELLEFEATVSAGMRRMISSPRIPDRELEPAELFYK
jgi:hypothetical protein